MLIQVTHIEFLEAVRSNFLNASLARSSVEVTGCIDPELVEPPPKLSLDGELLAIRNEWTFEGE